jgi:hypothetical protein
MYCGDLSLSGLRQRYLQRRCLRRHLCMHGTRVLSTSCRPCPPLQTPLRWREGLLRGDPLLLALPFQGARAGFQLGREGFQGFPLGRGIDLQHPYLRSSREGYRDDGGR